VLKIVNSLSEEVQDLVQHKRFDTDAWLDLRRRALLQCHPQHQICCEVAKWLVPILARGPGKSLADFPRELLISKMTMAEDYLRVLRVVEPGFSRNTAKTIFEKVDTWMFLSCDDYRCFDCWLTLLSGNITHEVQVLRLFLTKYSFIDLVFCCVVGVERFRKRSCEID